MWTEIVLRPVGGHDSHRDATYRGARRSADLTVNLQTLPARIYRARWAYLFLLPAAIAITLFQLLPVLRALALSFFRAGLTKSTFIGVDNYIRFATDPVSLAALRNTLTFVFIVVPVVTILSLVLAALIETFPQRLKALFRAAFYLPVVAGSVLLAIVWRWMFNSAYGLIPFGLNASGIDSPTFLGDPKVAVWALAVVAVVYNLGAPLLLYSAALAAIPSELQEAARIDGASERQVFLRVTLPLVRPATLFVLVITTIVVLQIWDIVQIMTLGGPEYSTTTLGYLVYTAAFANSQFGYASAVAIVLMVLVMAVAVIQFRLLER
jgi:multiple sugar transport system permease protein